MNRLESLNDVAISNGFVMKTSYLNGRNLIFLQILLYFRETKAEEVSRA